jgi:hypothetical protein
VKHIRLGALAVAVALTAAACGVATNDPGSSASSSPTQTPSDGVSATVIELFSPTETDQPLDLSGGATSSSEGVTVVEDNPSSDLSEIVSQATQPWSTNWARRTIDPGDLLLGIRAVDPRDVIPPIDTPKFEPIEAADWLGPREPGALVQFEGEVRFYPLSILTRHEIVNDRFGDIPVAITFCPLCNSALTFDTRVDGQALRFGVSGLLRNSDLVMWDDATTTLWQQITGEAIVGDLAGTQLDIIPTSIVSYGDARDAFPDALSLAQDTGFGIAYGTNPYEAYTSSSSPFLFDGEVDPRFPALSRVVGVTLGDSDKAYPFELISGERAVNDDLDGTPIAIFWGGDTADALDSRTIAEGQAVGSGLAFDRRLDDQTLTFTSIGGDLFADAETSSTWNLLGQAIDGPLGGEQLTVVRHRNEFWFAWASFFPDGAVYDPAASRTG